jgi:DNA-binding NarL/FixJ family response regulator
MSSRIDIIVVEDDEATCAEYESKAAKYDDIFLIGTTNSTKTALSLVQEYSPTAIILDLELHNGYGNGISFLTKLSELEIDQKPYVLVSTNNISPSTHNIVRNLGADFVITKNQQDYSVDMVLGFLTSILSSGAPISKKSAELETNQDIKANFKNKITTELDLIGISPKVIGRQYLSDAIELVADKRIHNISSILAQKYGKSDASIERAMETAINRTWRSTDIETLEKYYTAYIKPEKGVPTVTEFIYYYAQKIKNS